MACFGLKSDSSEFVVSCASDAVIFVVNYVICIFVGKIMLQY